MNFLRTGHFFGDKSKTICLDGITLTETGTEPTHENIDWHYHQNAYFTIVLEGELIESDKKKSYNCSAGSLLFHSSQAPHYNIKPDGQTRCFHVEFDEYSLNECDTHGDILNGIFTIENPDIKFLFYKIFQETKISDDLSGIAVRMLLFESFGQLLRLKQNEQKTKPVWVRKLREILYDCYSEKMPLEDLSGRLNIHPVHLSRDFRKYFHCTLGEYLRKIRVEKSLAFLSDKNLSLTDIAFKCGFADQSHFLRSFKQVNGIKPSTYRKILAR